MVKHRKRTDRGRTPPLQPHPTFDRHTRHPPDKKESWSDVCSRPRLLCGRLLRIVPSVDPSLSVQSPGPASLSVSEPPKQYLSPLSRPVHESGYHPIPNSGASLTPLNPHTSCTLPSRPTQGDPTSRPSPEGPRSFSSGLVPGPSRGLESENPVSLSLSLRSRRWNPFREDSESKK